MRERKQSCDICRDDGIAGHACKVTSDRGLLARFYFLEVRLLLIRL